MCCRASSFGDSWSCGKPLPWRCPSSVTERYHRVTMHRIVWVERSDTHPRERQKSDGFRMRGTHPTGLTAFKRSRAPSPRHDASRGMGGAQRYPSSRTPEKAMGSACAEPILPGLRGICGFTGEGSRASKVVKRIAGIQLVLCRRNESGGINRRQTGRRSNAPRI